MATTAGAVKVGVDSVALPGQLIATPPTVTVSPYSFQQTGQGVQFPPPSTPPTMGSISATGGPSPVMSVGGYSTAASRGAAAAIAGAKPFSVKHSAVVPALGMLIVGLVLMWWIFWKKDPELREVAGD
jgi:hypothetical protein